MSTCRAELELAVIHLQRAEELARFFSRPQEEIELIGKLKRGTVHVQQKLADKISGPNPR